MLVFDGRIPLGRVLAGANRHDSPLLDATLDRLDALGPLPDHESASDNGDADSAVTVLDRFLAAGISRQVFDAHLAACQIAVP